MADLSITAANVLHVSGGQTGEGVAGETITAGQPVWIDASASNVLKRCDANLSASAANCVGIALHGSSSGQPLKYAKTGDINLGATLVVGQVYVCSATVGGVCPYADLTTGDYPTVLGVASSSSNLKMGIKAGGAAKP